MFLYTRSRRAVVSNRNYPAFVYIIPIGMIQAITNQQIGLNVITELIIGYALPGHPIAMMLFKTWGYITMAQGGHLFRLVSKSLFVLMSGISAAILVRFQAWSLHEDPPTV